MNIECKCTYNFTCKYCLANAKPYFFTPSTISEQVHGQAAKCTDFVPSLNRKPGRCDRCGRTAQEHRV